MMAAWQVGSGHYADRRSMTAVAEPPEAVVVRGAPSRPHGGPLALLRFARRNRMLTPDYALLRCAGRG